MRRETEKYSSAECIKHKAQDEGTHRAEPRRSKNDTRNTFGWSRGVKRVWWSRCDSQIHDEVISRHWARVPSQKAALKNTREREEEKLKKTLVIDWVSLFRAFVHVICMPMSWDKTLCWMRYHGVCVYACMTQDLTRNDCTMDFLGLTIDSQLRGGNRKSRSGAASTSTSSFTFHIGFLLAPALHFLYIFIPALMIPINIIIPFSEREAAFEIPYLHKNLNPTSHLTSPPTLCLLRLLPRSFLLFR